MSIDQYQRIPAKKCKIQDLLNGKADIDKKIVDSDGALINGYDLTDEINEQLAGTILKREG